MEPQKKELTLEESIKQVMQTLPPVIRAYLAQGKYTIVAKGLMTKYGLRVDQAGVLEREIMLLLMGIENPDEFTKSLIEEAKLDQKVVNSIVQDINSQIFMPLRAEEMKASQPATVVPAISKVGPPEGSQKFFHLQNKIPAPQALRPAVVPGAGGPRPANPGLRDVLASVAKPADASRMLEDHEEPHIEFKSPEVRPSPVIPKVEPQIQPRPVAPGARFTPTTPSLPTPAEPYSADPYRESIE